eukprot:3220267-Pleurochrysis_carterae.AAC.2
MRHGKLCEAVKQSRWCLDVLAICHTGYVYGSLGPSCGTIGFALRNGVNPAQEGCTSYGTLRCSRIWLSVGCGDLFSLTDTHQMIRSTLMLKRWLLRSSEARASTSFRLRGAHAVARALPPVKSSARLPVSAEARQHSRRRLRSAHALCPAPGLGVLGCFAVLTRRVFCACVSACDCAICTVRP